MHVVNPQVINGQQTTRILHQHAARNSKATVLVRVISVPRDSDESSNRFENLVSKIVAATNWQNAISASDLMANDRTQIEIERNLRKLNCNYYYIRKRETKGEARRRSGIRYAEFIKKDDLARAVAACELDPSIVREAKNNCLKNDITLKFFRTPILISICPVIGWSGMFHERHADTRNEHTQNGWLPTSSGHI